MGMSNLGDSKPKIIFRLGHLGDVVLTTGVLTRWHEQQGDTFIVITRAGNGPVFDNHPAVAEVIGINEDVLKNDWFAEARRLAARYNGHTLVDLHGILRSRILSLVWRGTVLRYPKFSLTRRLFERTHADMFRKKLEAHNVPQRYCMAMEDAPPAARTLVPRLYLSDAERTATQTRLDNTPDNTPVIALHPYATNPAKQWPREHWLDLIDLLTAADMDWFVVGRDDEPLLPNHERDFTNATNLRETCGLLDRADILVTGDSGPMHLASGVGTPVIALFGPTAKSWGFYPAGEKDRVLAMDMDCRPCSLHGSKSCAHGYKCMAGLTPARVMETTTALLD